MKEFLEPKVEVIKFDVEDVITTSGNLVDPEGTEYGGIGTPDYGFG